MIRFSCPKCKQLQERPDNSAGQVVRCDCGQSLRVPPLPAVKTAPAPKPKPPADDEVEQLEEVEDLEEVEKPRSRRSSRADEDEDEPLIKKRSRRRDDEEVDSLDEVDGEGRPVKKKKRRKGELRDLPREADDLGDLRTIHEISKVAPIIGIIFCGLVVFGALICIPLCFVARNPAPLLLTFIGVPLGGLGILWASWNMGLKVFLFEGGFVQAKRSNFVVVPWEEVEFVWQAITEHYYNGAYTGTTYQYTLQLYDGTYLKLSPQLKGIEALGKEIMHHTSQVLFNKLMRRYQKGKVADFGTLGISKDGLHYGSSVLDWDEIDAVQVKAGYISVSKRGKWFNWCNIAASNVPNLWVFLSMVDQIIGVDR